MFCFMKTVRWFDNVDDVEARPTSGCVLWEEWTSEEQRELWVGSTAAEHEGHCCYCCNIKHEVLPSHVVVLISFCSPQLDDSLMMMISGFVDSIINNPQMRCRSAKQVGLQMSREHQRGKSCGLQSGWQTVPNDWTCDRKTPHPQRDARPWIWC